MDIVVDASVLLAVLLNEPEKKQLISLTKAAELTAPEIMPYEIGNALSAMFKRHRLTQEQIMQSLAAYETIPLRLVKSDRVKALRLACQYNIYAYYAYYLETAQRLRLPLLTLDRQLKQIARRANLNILEAST
ncbi:MAG: type II toxin-antitoxin system VapC family toxin [Candidatus Margulisbacteria bacterium]|jgi:predicted nucleic acid-binding protein|nr:type II toxin-antitoxin system VapC family toxin [Candidatus Margulisiibacteriota bacterium]